MTSRWKTRSWFSSRATHHKPRGFYLFIHIICIQVLCGQKTLLRLGFRLSTSQEAHSGPSQNDGSSLLLVLFPLTLSHDPRDSSIVSFFTPCTVESYPTLESILERDNRYLCPHKTLSTLCPFTQTSSSSFTIPGCLLTCLKSGLPTSHLHYDRPSKAPPPP